MIDQKQILDNLYDGLYTVSLERKILYWNKAAENLTGYTAAEMTGCYCYDSPLKHVDREGNDLCRDGCPLTWAMSHRCKHEDEIFFRHRDGYRVPINVRVSPIYDPDGRVEGASELFRDNTPSGAIAARLAELEELAMLDPLTKLANEKFAKEQIKHYLEETHRYAIKVGVALFQIDNINSLIDKHGLKVFEQLQIVAGRTLQRNSRPLDMIARLNQGLYLGLFRNVSDNQLHAICEKMRLLFAKGQVSTGQSPISGTLSAGGHCLRKHDTLEKVTEICQKQLDNCREKGGNKCAVDIHFVAV